MKKIYKVLILLTAVFIAQACQDALDLDLQENPDELTLASADPDLIFNSTQGSFFFLSQASAQLVEEPMRLRYQFGSYLDVIDQTSMNGPWAVLYTGNNNIDELEAFANNNGYQFHYGAALVTKASNYLNVADLIGGATIIEANNPLEFPNPGLDDASVVYDSAFAMLDRGISYLERADRIPQTDIFGNQEAANWIKFANTVKLRMWLQTRLVNPTESAAAINQLIADGNIIDDLSEDFQFQFGTTGGVIESRHPDFVGNYLTGAADYQPNGLMSYMKDSTDAGDPRLTYYFYRQDPNDPADDLLPCETSSNHDFCYIGDLYWGRDHTDNEGIPGDANSRTTFGVYPAGGQYDEGQFIAASQTSAQGNGIFPVMLSSWVKFMLAEAALELGTTGDPKVYLEEGIRNHIGKVLSFAAGVATQADVDAYVAEVLTEYDAASNAQKLDIIIREWYLSSFGNGLLTYNNYRRTGYPSFIQSPIIAAGAFPRSFFLPESELNTNANESLEQKQTSDQLFWDTNPADFID